MIRPQSSLDVSDNGVLELFSYVFYRTDAGPNGEIFQVRRIDPEKPWQITVHFIAPRPGPYPQLSGHHKHHYQEDLVTVPDMVLIARCALQPVWFRDL